MKNNLKRKQISRQRDIGPIRIFKSVEVTFSRDPVVCIVVTVTMWGTRDVYELGIRSCSCDKVNHEQGYHVEFDPDLGGHLKLSW